MNNSDSDDQKKVASFCRKNGVCHRGWGAPHFFLNRALLRLNPALQLFIYVAGFPGTPGSPGGPGTSTQGDKGDKGRSGSPGDDGRPGVKGARGTITSLLLFLVSKWILLPSHNAGIHSAPALADMQTCRQNEQNTDIIPPDWLLPRHRWLYVWRCTNVIIVNSICHRYYYQERVNGGAFFSK